MPCLPSLSLSPLFCCEVVRVFIASMMQSNLAEAHMLGAPKQTLKPWNSFAGNSRDPGSPGIPAHFPTPDPVRHSADGTLGDDMLVTMIPDR